MKRKTSFFRTMLVWSVGVPLTLALSLSALIVFFLSGSKNLVHRHARIWGTLLLDLSGIRIRTEGMEHCPDNHPVLVVSNHQSMFDIFAYLAILPFRFHWIAKRELFRIPLVGYAMRSAGYVAIDRGRREKAYETIGNASDVLKETSLIIFPEGTRTRTGQMLPFKHGASYMLHSAQVPILPVTIIGSFERMPPGKLSVSPGLIRIVIDPEIPTAGVDRPGIMTILEQIRSRMILLMSEQASDG